MANTGNKITLSFNQINTTTNQVTGIKKPNVSSDPDYIPPGLDLLTCPVIFDTACPMVKQDTTGGGGVSYEFSLKNSVLNNPAVSWVYVKARSAGTLVVQHTFQLPRVNYFTGLLPLTAGLYDLEIEYLATDGASLATCSVGQAVIP